MTQACDHWPGTTGQHEVHRVQSYTLIRCEHFSNLDWVCDTICAHLRSLLTSGTHSSGHLANIPIWIVGKVSEIKKCSLVGLELDLCARRGTSGSVSCVESPPADSIARSSLTRPSVNGCHQSGMLSPPTLAGVD